MSGQQSSDLSRTAIIVMGVCGCGKSKLATQLSEELGFSMIEADDFHSDSNRAKMAKGIGLTDEDRKPWLQTVSKAAEQKAASDGGVVVACSSLRRIYRDVFRSSLGDCKFIHLTGSKDLIASRLTNRSGHFVDAGLLDSQLATLEPLEGDETGFTIDVALPVSQVLEAALQRLSKV